MNAIEELNIRGQRSSGLLGTGRIQGLDFIANTKTIKKIYAMGAKKGADDILTVVKAYHKRLDLGGKT